MTKVEFILPCAPKCIFGRDCAGKYLSGICKEMIDELIERIVTKQLEEKVTRGNKITAAMTDHDGKVTVSEGKTIIDIKP